MPWDGASNLPTSRAYGRLPIGSPGMGTGSPVLCLESSRATRSKGKLKVERAANDHYPKTPLPPDVFARCRGFDWPAPARCDGPGPGMGARICPTYADSALLRLRPQWHGHEKLDPCHAEIGR